MQCLHISQLFLSGHPWASSSFKTCRINGPKRKLRGCLLWLWTEDGEKGALSGKGNQQKKKKINNHTVSYCPPRHLIAVIPVIVIRWDIAKHLRTALSRRARFRGRLGRCFRDASPPSTRQAVVNSRRENERTERAISMPKKKQVQLHKLIVVGYAVFVLAIMGVQLFGDNFPQICRCRQIEFNVSFYVQ